MVTGEEFLLWCGSAATWSDWAPHNVCDEIDAAFDRLECEGADLVWFQFTLEQDSQALLKRWEKDIYVDWSDT